MTLDEYFDQWKADAPIDPVDLDGAARHVPILHAKWWRFYTGERLNYRKLDFELKTLIQQKTLWYSGKMIDEDRLALQWPINPVKVLPNAMNRTIDADAQVQSLNKKKALAEETLKFLEDVIAQINKRGFHISNAINYLKFKMGV
jgi:hypothetical protein